MISYAPSDSLVDRQGMIAQESTLWETPGKRKSYMPRFFSPEHRSNNFYKKRHFRTALQSSHVLALGVVSGTLPKSDRAQEGRRTAPVAVNACRHSIIIV
jgi:hypothetical protein